MVIYIYIYSFLIWKKKGGVKFGAGGELNEIVENTYYIKRIIYSSMYDKLCTALEKIATGDKREGIFMIVFIW